MRWRFSSARACNLEQPRPQTPTIHARAKTKICPARQKIELAGRRSAIVRGSRASTYMFYKSYIIRCTVSYLNGRFQSYVVEDRCKRYLQKEDVQDADPHSRALLQHGSKRQSKWYMFRSGYDHAKYLHNITRVRPDRCSALISVHPGKQSSG